jgi:micrococcal nuclease
VLRTVDGEVFEIFGGTRIILIGVDAPEIVPSECFGIEAQRRLAELLDGYQVYLSNDRLELDSRTSYLWRYAWDGDRLINEQIIREGFARARIEEPNTRFSKELIEAERQARDEKLGLWSLCPPP